MSCSEYPLLNSIPVHIAGVTKKKSGTALVDAVFMAQNAQKTGSFDVWKI